MLNYFCEKGKKTLMSYEINNCPFFKDTRTCDNCIFGKEIKILEADEQKALVTRCQIEKVMIIGIENSLQIPIAAILDIVRPFVKPKQLEVIKRLLQNLMGILTNKRYSQGMLKGCPDLFFPDFNLFIELKRRDGGVVSKEQAEVHQELRLRGYKVVVCYGAKAAWETIEGLRNEQKRN